MSVEERERVSLRLTRKMWHTHRHKTAVLHQFPFGRLYYKVMFMVMNMQNN